MFGFNKVTVCIVSMVLVLLLANMAMEFRLLFIGLVICFAVIMGVAHGIDLWLYKNGWQKKTEPKKSVLVAEETFSTK